VSSRILIVDDEPALRRTLERALRGHRYEVMSDWPAELASCPVLPKPFSLDTLIKTVGAVLAAAEPRSDLLKGNGNG
jgi:PleD family two-component response regulator